MSRHQDEERRVRQSTFDLTSFVQNEVGTKEDKEDDEGVGDERDIWEVTHVTEEDFERTDGEEEDIYEDIGSLFSAFTSSNLMSTRGHVINPLFRSRFRSYIIR
jgi:hypothetical protein